MGPVHFVTRVLLVGSDSLVPLLQGQGDPTEESLLQTAHGRLKEGLHSSTSTARSSYCIARDLPAWPFRFRVVVRAYTRVPIEYPVVLACRLGAPDQVGPTSFPCLMIDREGRSSASIADCFRSDLYRAQRVYNSGQRAKVTGIRELQGIRAASRSNARGRLPQLECARDWSLGRSLSRCLLSLNKRKPRSRMSSMHSRRRPRTLTCSRIRRLSTGWT